MIKYHKKKQSYLPLGCVLVVAGLLIAYAVKHPVRVTPDLELTSPIVFEGNHMTLGDLLDYTVTGHDEYVIEQYWYELSEGESLRSNVE